MIAVRIMAEALCESMLFGFHSFVFFFFCEYDVVGRRAMNRVEGLEKPGSSLTLVNRHHVKQNLEGNMVFII